MAGSEITGDFGKLAKLADALGAGEQAKLEAAVLVAEWVRKSVGQEFWQHRDPYGQEWAPRKQPDRRTNPLMVDTATLMTGFVYQATADGVEGANYTPYAAYLQDGTSRMPARKMFPDDGDLGEWEEPLVKVALDALIRRLGEV